MFVPQQSQAGVIQNKTHRILCVRLITPPIPDVRSIIVKTVVLALQYDRIQATNKKENFVTFKLMSQNTNEQMEYASEKGSNEQKEKAPDS